MDSDAAQDFQARHELFLQARRRLCAEGASPRLASALANLGIDSLAALQLYPWDGPGGLRLRLVGRRLVGPRLLREARRFHDQLRANSGPEPPTPKPIRRPPAGRSGSLA